MRSGLTKGLTILILAVYCFTALAYAAVSAASLTITLSNRVETNTVTGIVRADESGLPLVHGTVSINGKTAEISNGHFVVKDIPLGTHTVEISGPYRQSFTAAIIVEPGINQHEFSVSSRFDQGEIDLLAKIIRAEAEGESALGKTAVAATILNRVKSKRYPSTIAGVVYQRVNGRYQYSPVANGRINVPPRSEDYHAAFQALAGSDPTYGATGFYNPAKTRDRWVRSYPVTTVIDGHTFFKY